MYKFGFQKSDTSMVNLLQAHSQTVSKAMGVIVLYLGLIVPSVVFASGEFGSEKPPPLRSISFSELAYRVSDISGIGVAQEETVLAIIETLRTKGLNVLGFEGAAFGENKSEESELVLAGTVRELNCVGTFEQSCRILVTWELFDRSRNEIVYRVDTGAIQKGIVPGNRERKLIKLIKTAVQSLMDREMFEGILRQGDAVTDAEVTTFIDEPDEPLSLPPNSNDEQNEMFFYTANTYGAVLITIGSFLAFVTYASTKADSEGLVLTQDELKKKTTFNRLGWMTAGVGIGILGTSLLVRFLKKSKQREARESSSVARLNFSLSMNSAVLKVSF